MSARKREEPALKACAGCLRRSWLLAALAAPLDYVCPDRQRLFDVLALGDEELMQALAGRRRSRLKAEYAHFAPDQPPRPGRIGVLCRHDDRFPQGLRFPSAPRALYLSHPSAEWLQRLSEGPVVAIVGSSRASDYGMEVARSLARSLASAGVIVACGLADGIPVAALAGALEAEGAVVCVMPGGVDVVAPAGRRALYERLARRGCAVSELPCGARPRPGWQAASERITAGVAQLTVVVEACDNSRELACARLAGALERLVAAVPGRVTAPLSGGTNALLAAGAKLIRGPQDVLELLSPLGSAPRDGERLASGEASRCRRAQPPPTRGQSHSQRKGNDERGELEPRLRRTLERVSSGDDTPSRLARGGQDVGAVLHALSELELMGLLTRGDGGRYLPQVRLPGQAP